MPLLASLSSSLTPGKTSNTTSSNADGVMPRRGSSANVPPSCSANPSDTDENDAAAVEADVKTCSLPRNKKLQQNAKKLSSSPVATVFHRLTLNRQQSPLFRRYKNNETSSRRDYSPSPFSSTENGGGVGVGAQQSESKRDLFGVHIELYNLLIETERRKLKTLHCEMQQLSTSFPSLQSSRKYQHISYAKQRLTRLQTQLDQLEHEYRRAAYGALKCNHVHIGGYGSSTSIAAAANRHGSRRNSLVNAAHASNSTASATSSSAQQHQQSTPIVKQTIKTRPSIFGSLATLSPTRASLRRRTIDNSSNKKVDGGSDNPPTTCTTANTTTINATVDTSSDRAENNYRGSNNSVHNNINQLHQPCHLTNNTNHHATPTSAPTSLLATGVERTNRAQESSQLLLLRSSSNATTATAAAARSSCRRRTGGAAANVRRNTSCIVFPPQPPLIDWQQLQVGEAHQQYRRALSPAPSVYRHHHSAEKSFFQSSSSDQFSNDNDNQYYHCIIPVIAQPTSFSITNNSNSSAADDEEMDRKLNCRSAAHQQQQRRSTSAVANRQQNSSSSSTTAAATKLPSTKTVAAPLAPQHYARTPSMPITRSTAAASSIRHASAAQQQRFNLPARASTAVSKPPAPPQPSTAVNIHVKKNGTTVVAIGGSSPTTTAATTTTITSPAKTPTKKLSFNSSSAATVVLNSSNSFKSQRSSLGSSLVSSTGESDFDDDNDNDSNEADRTLQHHASSASSSSSDKKAHNHQHSTTATSASASKSTASAAAAATSAPANTGSSRQRVRPSSSATTCSSGSNGTYSDVDSAILTSSTTSTTASTSTSISASKTVTLPQQQQQQCDKNDNDTDINTSSSVCGAALGTVNGGDAASAGCSISTDSNYHSNSSSSNSDANSVNRHNLNLSPDLMIDTVPDHGEDDGGHAEHEQEKEQQQTTKVAAELRYENGTLVSGTLESLIAYFMPTSKHVPERTFSFAFVLGCRLFLRPEELLERVELLCIEHTELCEMSSTTNSLKKKRSKHRDRNAYNYREHDEDTVAAFRHYLCNNEQETRTFCRNVNRLLSDWAETFPYDFRQEFLMLRFKSLAAFCTRYDHSLSVELDHTLQLLLQKLSELDEYEQHLARISQTTIERMKSAVNLSSAATDVAHICPSASALAQQLTHVELERMQFIDPEEFVEAISDFFKQNNNRSNAAAALVENNGGKHRRGRACSGSHCRRQLHNLDAYVDWFNRLSYLVATEVCMQLRRKHRIRLIEYFVEVAKECFNLGNYNSLMAIIAGLNMSSVRRLKRTWKSINPAKLDALENAMSPSQNFFHYRSTLKAAMWRSAGSSSVAEKIIVPFFSLLIKDVYFLKEGCAGTLNDGTVNFTKFWQLAKQVSEFMAWREVICPFERRPPVIDYVLTTAVFSETGLALASFECEQPETTSERERCRQLKMTLNQAPGQPVHPAEVH